MRHSCSSRLWDCHIIEPDSHWAILLLYYFRFQIPATLIRCCITLLAILRMMPATPAMILPLMMTHYAMMPLGCAGWAPAIEMSFHSMLMLFHYFAPAALLPFQPASRCQPPFQLSADYWAAGWLHYYSQMRMMPLRHRPRRLLHYYYYAITIITTLLMMTLMSAIITLRHWWHGHYYSMSWLVIIYYYWCQPFAMMI